MKPLIHIIIFFLFGALPVMSGQVEGDSGGRDVDGEVRTVTIRVPFSIKKNALPAGVEIYRENIGNDSLEFAIPESDLETYRSAYPTLKIVPAAPLIDGTDMAADLDEAMTFTKYPTYAQYVSMLHVFAETYPAICRVDTFGRSVEGRLLLALKISDNVEVQEDEPAFLYSSTMHGDELVGYMLSLRLIDFILSNYGENVEVDRIVNDLEIWINPLSNPDGTYYPDNNNSVAGSIRNNVNNVNLNRNFPEAGLGEADDTTGREPETKYMMAFMHRIGPNLSANIHAGAEVVNYPWDHKSKRHPDNDWYILVSGEYADVAQSVDAGYMNEFTDGITNGFDWYEIFGGRQDYVNYYLHGREVTLELSNIKKIESETFEYYWSVNKWSLVNYITQASYGIHGKVTDRYNGKPVKARVWVMDHDNDSSWVESDGETGNFYRYLKGGTYDLAVSAEGYISDTVSGVVVTDYYRTGLTVELDSAGLRGIGGSPAGDLRIYPNPASTQFTIRTQVPFEKRSSILLHDLSGRTVYRKALPQGSVTFSMNVSELNAGVYVVEVSDGSGTRYTELLKVKH